MKERCPPGSGQPRDRGHDEGPPGRLRPPAPAGPCRARPGRRRRRRDQRVRHRPGRRGGPHLHLPAPGPPREDPRPRGRAAARRRRPGSRRHPGLPASRPARRPRACRQAERPRPAAGKTPVRGARRTGLARVRARARPPTSTPSTRRSASWGSRSSTCGSSSKNRARTWPRPGPRTASSWPSSTPRQDTGDTPGPDVAQHLSQSLTFSLSASELREREDLVFAAAAGPPEKRGWAAYYRGVVSCQGANSLIITVFGEEEQSGDGRRACSRTCRSGSGSGRLPC